MPTKMPICEELGKVANSTIVKDMMLVHYEREVEDTLKELHELRAKVCNKRVLINHRDKMIKELELLFAFDSVNESIADLRRMHEEDNVACDVLLVDIAQHQSLLGDLGKFINKIGSMPY